MDELVGRINGNYGSITWTPVRYLNQEFSMDERIDLYSLSDIALILPLRDGMNLVAKEFVASRHNGEGVLILSELAGASKELHEALLVNPNNLDAIDEALFRRFSEKIEVPIPDATGKAAILAHYLKKKRGISVDVLDEAFLLKLAERARSFSGGYLEILVKRTINNAAHEGARMVERCHFETPLADITHEIEKNKGKESTS